MKLSPVILQWLLPILVPAVVALLKTFRDNLGDTKIPKLFLPIVAAVIGILIDYLSGLTLGTSKPALDTISNGALLGLAGVGIREVFDQFRKLLTRSN